MPAANGANITDTQSYDTASTEPLSLLDCLDSKDDLDDLLSLPPAVPRASTSRAASPPRPETAANTSLSPRPIASTSYLAPGTAFSGKQIFQTAHTSSPPFSISNAINALLHPSDVRLTRSDEAPPNQHPLYRVLLSHPQAVSPLRPGEVLNTATRPYTLRPRPDLSDREAVQQLTRNWEREQSTLLGRREAVRDESISISPKKVEEWSVRVFVRNVDWQKGKMDGFMSARTKKQGDMQILTYFDGEIIGRHHSLFREPRTVMTTEERSKLRQLDQKYWAQLSSFSGVDPEAIKENGYNSGMFGFVLMRWKEKAFIGDVPPSLTIEGEYFISMSRRTGAIEGLYVDPVKHNPSPQRLDLQPFSSQDSLATDVSCEYTIV